jgi:hypothetical protein
VLDRFTLIHHRQICQGWRTFRTTSVQIFPLLPFPALIALFLMAALHAHQPHDCLLATHQTSQQCLLDLASGTAPSLAQFGRMLSIERYRHRKFSVLSTACSTHRLTRSNLIAFSPPNGSTMTQ